MISETIEMNVIPNNWKYISESLKKSENENSSMLVYSVTWNLKGNKPTKEELKIFLDRESGKTYNLFVIATQECMRGIFSSFFYANKDEWIKMLSEELGNEYTILKEESLSASHLIVFCENKLFKQIKNVFSSTIKTGFGNIIGNKGGIGISFEIENKSFLLLNCHLAAGHNTSEKRNLDFHRINYEFSIGNYKPSVYQTLTDQVDYCIFMGDFNYRIDLDDPNDALALIKKEEIEKLIEFDQLSCEVYNHRLDINSFTEGIITFNPTYKYFTGEKYKDYDLSERTPGWTDRILFKSKDHSIIQCKYDSYSNTFTSDHKPVYSVFKIDLKENNSNDTQIIKDQVQSDVCVIY